MSGHIGVNKNEKADQTAKEAAERPGTQRCPKRFTSLAYVGRTVTERKLKEASTGSGERMTGAPHYTEHSTIRF